MKHASPSTATRYIRRGGDRENIAFTIEYNSILSFIFIRVLLTWHFARKIWRPNHCLLKLPARILPAFESAFLFPSKSSIAVTTNENRQTISQDSLFSIKNVKGLMEFSSLRKYIKRKTSSSLLRYWWETLKKNK